MPYSFRVRAAAALATAYSGWSRPETESAGASTVGITRLLADNAVVVDRERPWPVGQLDLNARFDRHAHSAQRSSRIAGA